MAKLRICSVNIWGLPYPISRDRQFRVDSLIEALMQKDYDVVLMQEVWMAADQRKICSKLKHLYPHSFYFKSGIFGSGLMVLSSSSILETFLFRFSLSGYPHRVQHGDWFVGKSVGVARVRFGEFLVNVAVTHTHADYRADDSLYGEHRLVQAIELSQFASLLRHSGDATLLAGDFNFRPEDLGRRLIGEWSGLDDAWLFQERDISAECCNTSCHPTNAYSGSPGYEGKRIDYVLFGATDGCKVRCLKCSLTLGRIPETSLSYSDHEAIEAMFHLEKQTTEGPSRLQSPLPSIVILQDAHHRLVIFEQKLCCRQNWLAFASVLLMIVALAVPLCLHIILELPDWVLVLMQIVQTALIIISTALAAFAILFVNDERSATSHAISKLQLMLERWPVDESGCSYQEL